MFVNFCELEFLNPVSQQLIEERRNAATRERAAGYDEDTLTRIAFDFLDGNKNGEIAQYELTSQKYLDPTPDNSFSHAEAKTMMKSRDKLTFDEFKADLWDEISNKIIVKLDSQMDKFEQEKIDAARRAEEEEREVQQDAEQEEPQNAEEQPGICYMQLVRNLGWKIGFEIFALGFMAFELTRSKIF